MKPGAAIAVGLFAFSFLPVALCEAGEKSGRGDAQLRKEVLAALHKDAAQA